MMSSHKNKPKQLSIDNYQSYLHISGGGACSVKQKHGDRSELVAKEPKKVKMALDAKMAVVNHKIHRKLVLQEMTAET